MLDLIPRIFFNEFEFPDSIERLFPEKLTKKELDVWHFASMRFGKYISDTIGNNAYERINLTSKLFGSAIRSVRISRINRKFPALTKVELEHEKKIDVEILKQTVYASQILSPKMQIVAFRSKQIIETIFETLSKDEGYMLMPEDFRSIYEAVKGRANKFRVICDFIAGMTDRYALEFYGRLTSENPETIFKPL